MNFYSTAPWWASACVLCLYDPRVTSKTPLEGKLMRFYRDHLWFQVEPLCLQGEPLRVQDDPVKFQGCPPLLPVESLLGEDEPLWVQDELVWLQGGSLRLEDELRGIETFESLFIVVRKKDPMPQGSSERR
jgi:hypothetical protein